MKGLLLKDFYMSKAYCKSYLLIIVAFLAASFIGGNLFFIYYPCLLGGMVPVTLLAYDERSRFIRYCSTLPVSRAQFVSEKYLIGLLSQLAVILLTGVAHGIRMRVNGTFAAGEFAVLLLSMLLVSMLGASIPLPFIFRYGVEKGRISYYVMVGFVCAAGFLLSGRFQGKPADMHSSLIFAVLSLLGIGVYIFSQYLSAAFFKKREL